MSNGVIRIDELTIANTVANSDLFVVVQNTAGNAVTRALPASLLSPTVPRSVLPVVFQVGLSANVAYANTIWNPVGSQLNIPFDSTTGVVPGFNPQNAYNFSYDTLGTFNPSIQPVFVAPSSGIYYFHLAVKVSATILSNTFSSLWSAITQYRHSIYVTQIFMNRTDPLYTGGNSNTFTLTASGGISCNTGEYVFASIGVNSGVAGANLTVLANGTYFTGFQVH
jgi:hypothetical protein